MFISQNYEDQVRANLFNYSGRNLQHLLASVIAHEFRQLTQEICYSDYVGLVGPGDFWLSKVRVGNLR
jgi:hypothetical protein